MRYTFKSPETVQEWQAYYKLRWEILRAPLQQPRGSEQDELEATAYHVMAIDENGNVVGTGRLHLNDSHSAQIRYMAIKSENQRNGIGSRILALLETQARKWSCQEIVLNARATCLAFYENHNYRIVADAPHLFGKIAHKRMIKTLDSQ